MSAARFALVVGLVAGLVGGAAIVLVLPEVVAFHDHVSPTTPTRTTTPRSAP